jgi:hypothetical protein
MGIEDIHILTDPHDDRAMMRNHVARQAPAARKVVANRGGSVSQHIVEQDEKKYVFGWDHPQLTFFLQVHDLTVEDKDEQIEVWLGCRRREIYEVEDLIKVARKHGLDIPHETRVKLYGEKDDGR